MLARQAGLISSHVVRRLRPLAAQGGWVPRLGSTAGGECCRPLASDASSGGFGSRFSRWITGDDQDGRGNDGRGGGVPGGRGDVQDDSDPSSDGSNAVLVNEGPSPLKYPQVLAVPLPRMPLYPGIMMPVTIKDEEVVREIKRLGDGGLSYVGAFLARDKSALADEADRPLTPADLIYDIGSLAHVRTVTDMEGGGARVELVGHRRIRKGDPVSDGPPLTIKIDHLRDDGYDRSSAHLKATVMEVIATLQDLVVHNPLYREKLQYVAQLGIDINDASKLADLGAYLTSADEAELQQVMEELRVEERLNLSLQLLKNEVQLSKLQAEIGKNVEAKLSDAQRRYFLQEQLKQIKKELGMEKDDKSAVISRLEEKFAPFKAGAGEEVQRVVEDEMAKLGGLEPSSSEFNITRNYLDWLTSIPWGHTVDEALDIARAQRVLDEDHHGLGDVKERILEFIAVARLRGSTQGKIICLSGPPGVGKTSVVKSVARALDRPFFRFSVGGLSDVAEIRGHRRTYVGAMPGKLVQGLKSTGACNPVVLIDEVDKLGRGLTGDPASALLEVLDPEQNASFMDHYLDVPLDLSKVLFICTANVLDTIPAPLLDRMEVIRLSGYIADEKAAIARQYLEPRARERAGVGEGQARLSDEAIAALIEDYAREAGVRALNNHLEKIYRKVALRLVRAEEAAGSDRTPPMEIASGDLAEYLGQPTFTSDHMYDPNPVGVVTGLAWTAMGGSTLHVEGSVVETGEGKGSVRTTGQLGDVMKESAVIAHVYARRLLEQLEPSNRFFADSVLHLHVPAGAVPKDGPSAGCTIITALMSLAIGRAPRPDMAMTGEVTLTGRILPIGGVREKAVAARRARVKLVVLPEGNRRDWDELPADVRAGLDARFVSDYSEIYDIAFDY